MGMNINGYIKNEEKGYWIPVSAENFGKIADYVGESGIRFNQTLRYIVLKAGEEFDFRQNCTLSLNKDLQIKLMNEVNKQYLALPAGDEVKKWCNLLLKFIKICIEKDYNIGIG